MIGGNMSFSKGKSKKSRKSEISSQTAGLLLGMLAIILGIIFLVGPGRQQEMEREDAEVYVGVFESFEVVAPLHWKNPPLYRLHFWDGRSFELLETYLTGTVRDSLLQLPAGTELTLLTDAQQRVLEIRRGDEEILNFNFVQKQLRGNARAFFWMGVSCFPCAAFLMIFPTVTAALKKRKAP